MKFLKVVNCHLNHCMPKTNGLVDWPKCGISVVAMKTLLVQGHIAVSRESDHVSLLPLSGEPNAAVLTVVNTANSNQNPLDSASIIDQAQYDAESVIIIAANEARKAAAQA